MAEYKTETGTSSLNVSKSPITFLIFPIHGLVIFYFISTYVIMFVKINEFKQNLLKTS